MRTSSGLRIRSMLLYSVLSQSIILGSMLPQMALAQTASAVSGVVTGVDGQPISEAVVLLSGNGPARAVRTDVRGRFTIAGIPAGTYAIALSAREYDPLAGTTIDVRPAASTNIALEMLRSSTSLITIGRVESASGQTVPTSSVPSLDLNAQAAAGRGETSVAAMLARDALSVTLIHPAGGNPAAPVVVALRGPDPTETLVDLDGHSVNSGGTGSFDLALLDPADLSDVQLVYGISPSSLVGPNTIDGAINVRTLEPTLQQHGLLRLSAGSFGSFAQTLQATGTHKRLGYAFSLHRTTTSGEVNNQPIVATDGTTATVGSAVDGNTALGKLRYSFGRGDEYVALTFHDQSQNRDLSAALSSIAGASTGAAAPPPVSGDQGVARRPLMRTADATTDPTSSTAAPTLFNSFAGSSLLAHNAGYGLDFALPLGARSGDGFARTTLLFRHLTSLADQSVFGPAAGSSLYLYNNHDDVGDDSVQVDHMLPKGLLSLKISTRSEQLDTQQVIAGSAQQDQAYLRHPLDVASAPAVLTGVQPLSGLGQTQRSAVIRYSFDPTAQLHYTAAAYYSNFTSFGTSLDPRVGIVWTPSAQSAIRFSAGSSFQSPQLPELYVPAALPPADANGYIDIGNAALKADHATEYDVGYEHLFGGVTPTRVTADLYRTNLRTPAQRYIPAVTCLDATTIVGPASCESFPINAGGAVYRGIELRTEHNITRSMIVRAGYSINSNYTTSVSPLFQNGSIVAGEQFQGSPLHRATLSIDDARSTGVAYEAGLVYEDAYNGLNRPAYATIHAGLTWHLPQGVDIGLYGTNLSNVYADKFTQAGAGVTYGGLIGPIASDAYALEGRKVMFVLTRRY